MEVCIYVWGSWLRISESHNIMSNIIKAKAVPLNAIKALGGEGY
jgi:hypothetical protein